MEFETKTELQTCTEHGDYMAHMLRFGPDKPWRFSCPQCSTEADTAEEARKAAVRHAEEQRRIEQITRAAGIPPRFTNRTFENYRAESGEQSRILGVARRYADNFEDRLRQGGGLIFCGRPGTGKTHLATAIANQVMRVGHTALFTSVLKASRLVKDTYRKGSETTEREVIGAFIKPHLLIVDEVGVQFGSETEKMILFEIINGRYEYVRPTIVISNLTEAELGAFIGERVVDRMQEGGGALLAFGWDSYRARVHKDADLRHSEVHCYTDRRGVIQ